MIIFIIEKFLIYIMSELDEIDHKIIEILKNDSRTPFTEIGTVLGISDSTVHVRLKKMKDDGVLRGFTVDLDEELLGSKVHGLVLINVNLGHLEEVARSLIETDSVRKVFETHGSNDLIASIDAKDNHDLREAIMEIRRIKNIASTALIPIWKVWK